MAKSARIAKADATSPGSLLCYLAFFGGGLCLVGFTFALMHAVLPFLQILIPLSIGWWLWQRYRTVQDRQQKRLRTAFYRLLRKHHGRVMLLDFAMAAKIPAIAARQFLDTRAKEFAARFEVTEHGDVVYVFSTLQWSRSQRSVPESSVSESSASEPLTAPIANDSDDPTAVPASLTQAELAKRLGVAAKTISRKKHLPTLSDWSRTRDPDGVGWLYTAQTQRFLPVSDRLPEQPETENS